MNTPCGTEPSPYSKVWNTFIKNHVYKHTCTCSRWSLQTAIFDRGTQL